MDDPSAIADIIENFVASAVIERGHSAYVVARAVARTFPDHDGLMFVFALSCVASAIEVECGGAVRPAFLPDPATCWRAAALLSADIYACRALSGQMPTGRDLLTLWQAHDVAPAGGETSL